MGNAKSLSPEPVIHPETCTSASSPLSTSLDNLIRKVDVSCIATNLEMWPKMRTSHDLIAGPMLCTAKSQYRTVLFVTHGRWNDRYTAPTTASTKAAESLLVGCTGLNEFMCMQAARPESNPVRAKIAVSDEVHLNLSPSTLPNCQYRIKQTSKLRIQIARLSPL